MRYCLRTKAVRAATASERPPVGPIARVANEPARIPQWHLKSARGTDERRTPPPTNAPRGALRWPGCSFPQRSASCFAADGQYFLVLAFAGVRLTLLSPGTAESGCAGPTATLRHPASAGPSRYIHVPAFGVSTSPSRTAVRFYVRVASACRPPKPRAANRYQSMISIALSLETHHSWKFQKHVTPRTPDLVGRVQLPPLSIDRSELHT
jgi:hypothetical protein